jgi:hypothetical protein
MRHLLSFSTLALTAAVAFAGTSTQAEASSHGVRTYVGSRSLRGYNVSSGRYLSLSHQGYSRSVYCYGRTYGGFSYRCYFPRYCCYGYYCPTQCCWYYYCAPQQCYLPVEYMNSYAPTPVGFNANLNANTNTNTNTNVNVNNVLNNSQGGVPALPPGATLVPAGGPGGLVK